MMFPTRGASPSRLSAEAGLTLLLALALAGLSAGCGGSSPAVVELSGGTIRRVVVSFSRQVRAGEPVTVSATLTDPFLSQCGGSCGVVRVRLVTSQGEVLGELSPGGEATISFARPGLYVVSPHLLTEPPGKVPETSVNDLVVVPVMREVGDVLLPADARVLTILRDGDLVRIFLHLTNAHLKTPQGDKLGYLDPAYRKVELFLIGLDEEGKELYRSEKKVVEVEGEKLLELRHTLRETEKTATLRLVVGVGKLVPSMRELFITPQSFDLALPPGQG